MREQPKVWCDAACGAKCGPNYTAAAARAQHEESCGQCAEMKNPPMATPAKTAQCKPWCGRSQDELRALGVWGQAYGNWCSPGCYAKALPNPAPAVGQRREWEGEKYTIVSEDHGRLMILFDSDDPRGGPTSWSVESLIRDKYLGEARVCANCKGYLRHDELHLLCQASKLPALAPRKKDEDTVVSHFDLSKAEREMAQEAATAKAASTCPNCRVTVPHGHIHFCAPKPPVPAKVTASAGVWSLLAKSVEFKQASAVAKAPGVRDWMVGLRDDWDNLPDA